jgi:hypothetical protein
MIVVDSSALIAILEQESDAAAFAGCSFAIIFRKPSRPLPISAWQPAPPMAIPVIARD